MSPNRPRRFMPCGACGLTFVASVLPLWDVWRVGVGEIAVTRGTPWAKLASIPELAGAVGWFAAVIA